MEKLKARGRRPTNEKALAKIRDAGSKEVTIKSTEWKLATPPGAYILRKYLKREYIVRSLASNKGWVVKRV